MSMDSAAKVYNAMVMPIIMYVSLINPWSTTTRKNKLKSLEGRARSIISENRNLLKLKVKIPAISDCQMEKVCTLTFRCIKKDLCENFNDYFDIIESKHVTRNNKNLIRLPKVRLECAKKGSHFIGAKTFNELSIVIRKAECLNDFKIKLRNLLDV